MSSNRSAPGWAFNFAREYFGLGEGEARRVIGKPGWRHMLALWEGLGEAIYHHPDYALRQEWFHRGEQPRRSCAEFYAAIPDGGILCDFGCGTAEGERCPYLDQGRPAILMDVDGPNFRYTEAKYAGYPVTLHAVNGSLPSRYDALLCTDVLEHIPHPMKMLSALWERLAPGGQAILWFDHSYPAPGHLPEAIQEIPTYDRWLLTETHIVQRNGLFDWVQKPKHWWQGR